MSAGTDLDVQANLDIEWPGGTLALSGAVHVMGVVNVTPDSFSDGGRWPEPDAAVRGALEMIDEGARIIDIGGESTRPGSDYVGAAEEIRRVVPVIEGLCRESPGALVSIDTRKSEVARAALDAGAGIVNDVSALRDDPALAKLAAEREVPVVLMHMRGTPADMQKDPHYDDLLGEVRGFFEEALLRAAEAGIPRSRTILDPGIGFGKRLEDNLALINRLDEFADLGRPVLVGASRKSFIGMTLGLPVGERLEGTLAATALAVVRGARIVRVHDVKANVRVVRMMEAMLAA